MQDSHREDTGAGGASRPQPRLTAVALGYRPTRDPAPQVVASGHGALAERILEIAFERGVKVREDADLAALLSIVEIGEEIPTEAFTAVAEILRYLYALNGRPAGPDGVGAVP